MKRYLFVVRSLKPVGGSEGVVAWMLEVLLERGAVTVLVEDGCDLAALDRAFGTRLAQRSLDVIVPDYPWLKWVQALGVPHRLLLFRSFLRKVRGLRADFDVCISSYNDVDLGEGPPAMQYMHGPPCNQKALLRQQNLNGRSGLAKLLAWANITLCELIAPWSDDRARDNWTVVNSAWTGREFERFYKAPFAGILFPPPLGECDFHQGRDRANSFISLGRAHEEKGLISMVEIVEVLRSRGHDVGLSLFVIPSQPHVLEELERLAKEHSSWLSLRVSAGRDEIDRAIVAHKYGLHGSLAESYGMAVAELVLGGCLTVVRDLGGQVEIVTETELRFESEGDAIEKLDRLLNSPELQETLLASQQSRRHTYSRAAFLDGFRHQLDLLEDHLESRTKAKVSGLR